MTRDLRLEDRSYRNGRDVERGWGQFKNDLAELVGFFGKNRGHPVLGTVGACDVVYWKPHDAVATDRRGEDVVERRIGPQDFLATIYAHLGIDYNKVTLPDFSGRPMPIVRDGNAIAELGATS